MNAGPSLSRSCLNCEIETVWLSSRRDEVVSRSQIFFGRKFPGTIIPLYQRRNGGLFRIESAVTTYDASSSHLRFSAIWLFV